MSEYISTRGQADPASFSQVIIGGQAPDKGLYVPTELPAFTGMDLRLMSAELHRGGYYSLFSSVVEKFIGSDVDSAAQMRLAREAYSGDVFDKTAGGSVTPVERLSDGIYLEELSLGPTAAFKDMALQPLGRYWRHVLGWGRLVSQTGRELSILGATSGDTGSAAEAAVARFPGVRIAMMSPDGDRMTEFQRAQMGELSGENVLNISIDGVFDDCQDMVKAIKADSEFEHLGAVNSINWGRIAFQIPYYFSGYLQVVGKNIGNMGQEIDVVVPSGNFGNVLAGYYARKMGLPIRRLIVATNQNNVLDTLIQTGRYRARPSKQVANTSSPSMDISKASNYERIVLDIMGGDTDKTRLYMEQFNAIGQASFDEYDLPLDTMKRLGFESGSAGEAQTIQAIQWAYRQAGRVIDPHTAVGISVAQRVAEDGVPVLCMSTALPVKFEHTIEEALGFVPERPERFVGLEERVAEKADAFVRLPNDIDAVKALLRARGFSALAA